MLIFCRFFSLLSFLSVFLVQNEMNFISYNYIKFSRLLEFPAVEIELSTIFIAICICNVCNYNVFTRKWPSLQLVEMHWKYKCVIDHRRVDIIYFW